jgi:hypothetical protein
VTWSKYRRLCLVLLMPLLIAGFIVTCVVDPWHRDPDVLCTQSLGTQQCHLDPTGKDYWKEVGDHPDDWFEFTTPVSKNATLNTYHILASARGVTAKINYVGYYSGSSDEQKSFLKTLDGRNALVLLSDLGGKQHPDSLTLPNGDLEIRCTDIEDKGTGDFEGRCWGMDWQGIVMFEVTGSGRQMIEDLNKAINQSIASGQLDFWAYVLIEYPMFIYGFLLLSLLAAIAKKATRYVKAG